MREAKIKRTTKETDIELCLNLEAQEPVKVETGVGFLDHMLTLMASHGHFSLVVRCTGDTEVDDHHSTEDIAIALGQAFSKALGDKRGICRYGSMLLPMDEALAQVALDLSGRSTLVWNTQFPTEKVGSFDTELFEEFFVAFVRTAGITLHVCLLAGTNTHHMAEAIFKGVGRSLSQAVAYDSAQNGKIPSTKGVLE